MAPTLGAELGALLSTFFRRLIRHDMTFDRFVSAIGKMHETCGPRSALLCGRVHTLCVEKTGSKQEQER